MPQGIIVLQRNSEAKQAMGMQHGCLGGRVVMLTAFQCLWSQMSSNQFSKEFLITRCTLLGWEVKVVSEHPLRISPAARLLSA